MHVQRVKITNIRGFSEVELDLRRPDLGKQLAFGFGPHFCLGASLARLEARVVFEELSRRYPDASLAGDELEWTGGAMLRRLVDLPIVLGKRHR